MKHRTGITLIILGMFILTQFMGLFVINIYNQNGLPAYLINEETSPASLIPSLIFTILIIMLLMKYKQKIVMRIWFILVVIIALFLSFNAILIKLGFNLWYLALCIATILALLKLFKPNKYLHNLTELLIYPGIAAIFISVLTVWSIIILLVLISLYDVWAVWHSGIMQKMAKFQMEEVGIFGGFLIPSLTKKQKELIKKAKKSKKINKLKRIKVGVAMLGGGDVIFPIITAGVFMSAFSSIIPAIFIIFGAFFGLTYLLLISEKTKFYPAMPFISFGIFASLALWRIIFY